MEKSSMLFPASKNKLFITLISFLILSVITNINSVRAQDCDSEDGCEKQFIKINKFARRGSPHAQILMGAFYRDGDHVKKDLQKSFMWYRKAAKQRPAIGLANHKVALAYLDGIGVKQDFDQTLVYLERAANTGYIKSQILMGILLLEGKVIKADYVKAKYWLNLAAKQQDPRAAFMLGELAEKGIAQDKNLETALKWYFVAADKGYQRAINKLKQFKLVTTMPNPEESENNASVERKLNTADTENKGEVLVVYANELSVKQMLDITLQNITQMKVYSKQWTGSHIPGRGCGDGMTSCNIIDDPELIRKMMGQN
jgi:hypothetical protein